MADHSYFLASSCLFQCSDRSSYDHLPQDMELMAPRPSPFMPPKKFDHPFKGKVYIHYQGLTRIILASLGGWAYTPIPPPGAKECHMFIPKTGWYVNEEGQKALIRHEMGHCNGWSPNHEMD